MGRMRVAAALFILLTLGGFAVGRASHTDEAIITVEVTSADHEAIEGYFSLGDSTTLMVKPDTDLYHFLNRRRGQKITIKMTDAGATLSRLDRQ
jgi:hypothetical protein